MERIDTNIYWNDGVVIGETNIFTLNMFETEVWLNSLDVEYIEKMEGFFTDERDLLVKKINRKNKLRRLNNEYR